MKYWIQSGVIRVQGWWWRARVAMGHGHFCYYYNELGTYTGVCTTPGLHRGRRF